MAYLAEKANVTLEMADRVATIRLARAARLNALDEAMHAELRDAFDRVARNAAIGAVILTGVGRAFSAGQDLQERAAAFEKGETPDLRASLETRYNPLIRTITSLPIPVIAAVNGVAYGAGAGIAIACDIVFAAASARFQFGFVNVGLGADCGASWTLPNIVGLSRALDLALTGRPIEAPEAAAMGLISRVVPDEQLNAVARETGDRLVASPPDAVRTIKRQFRVNSGGTLDAALDAERDAQAVLAGTLGYREAVLAFEKRRK